MRDLGRMRGLGFPVLAAVSHKEFTADASGCPRTRLLRHVTAAALASRAGVEMLRLHDVAERVPALRLADAIRTAEGA